MIVAVIILAYNHPLQIGQLSSALLHPRLRIYLHVDRRVALSPFAAALPDTRLADKITVLPRHPTVRGSVELVDATMEGLRAGLADGCDYFVLISGQDFPLRPPGDIVAFVERAGTRSYMEHWPIAESSHRFAGRDRTDFYTYTVRGRRELCIPRGFDTSFLGFKGRALNAGLRLRGMLMPSPRQFPPFARPFAGAMWWNISRPAAEYVLRFCGDHPDYRRYHQHTLAPDEIFFQSILAGTEYVEHYEVVSDNLRFYRWDGSHAATLTANDLPDILSSNKLFARKFDVGVDSEVLLRLATTIQE